MNDSSRRNSGSRSGSKNRNTFVTKSGKTIKLNRSLSDRVKARKDSFSRAKALRLAGMPKGQIGRFFYRLHPKRLYKYWFSREGGIMALKVAGVGIATGFLLLVGLFAYFRKDLPNLRDISGNNIGGSIRYYDRTGEILLWEDYDAVKRTPVEGDQIAQVMKDATIAVEDKDFFKHGGFDVRGITRAAFKNITGGSATQQGGSTITQQLVKLTQNWSKDRTYTRKVKELILSVELEREYTKDEILTGYLNTAPYGNVQYGVETASRDYFDKSAKDLTLDEAAFLAAIPKSPSLYSPYGAYFDQEALVGRMYYVLDLMEDQGKITKAQRDEAKKVEILAKYKQPKQKFAGITAPWFVLAAKSQIESERKAETVKRGGWKVITSLDMNLQKAAEEQVSKGLVQVRRQGGDVAAFVAEDVKTGQVVALVGGSDFTNEEYGQNNYARYRLPPGSSFKPYDYLALIEHHDNYGAGTVLYDTQGPLEGYPCTNKNRPKEGGNCLQNYDFRYPGPLTLRYALGGSRNVPAVKAMLITGVDKTIETAEKLMGDPRIEDNSEAYNCYLDDNLTKEGPCYASSAIGDGAYLRPTDHVHGLATISRNGVNIPQTFIMKIIDSGGNTLDEWKPVAGKQVVRADSAYIVADMMSDPNASYLGSRGKPQRYTNSKGTWEFSVKTGTTNDGKDGWMTGFSTQYAAVYWVGYHNRQRAMSGSMEAMTQPVFYGWMSAAHKDLAPEKRVRPAGIQSLPAYVVRTHVGLASVEPSPANDIYPSWFKAKTTATKRQTIDIVSNKLATDCTPARARKDVTEGDASSFSGDRFVQGGAIATESDDVHQCSDTRPSLSALVKNPDGSISVTVFQGTHPLSSDRFKGTVNFLSGGQVIQSFTVSSSGETVTLPASAATASSITAEVVDSVLYDGQSPNSVAGSGGGSTPAPFSITSPSNGGSASGATTQISWSGGTPNYTVLVDNPGGGSNFTNSPTCSNVGSNSCSITTATPGTYRIKVRDGSGTETSEVTFTK